MIVFDESNLPELWRQLSAGNLEQTVSATLAEDRAAHDITSQALCMDGEVVEARVVTRETAVCAGLGLLEGFAKCCGVSVSVRPELADGARVAAGASLAIVRGTRRSILPIERSMLNLLSVAMATATLTARYVAAVEGTRARVCDTRKTIPGLRWLQKYAVACGGGCLHRMALDDAMLVKDNHVAGLSPQQYAERIQHGVARVRATGNSIRFVCAEADTLQQFEALLALPAGTVEIALLDNFSVAQLGHAVALRDASGSSMLLEASGGVRLETISSIARSGIDRISVGALTHSAGSIDLALDMD